VEITRGILNVLKHAATLFRENGIAYCLAGGLAVSLLARPRATEDVDLFVVLEECDFPSFEALVRSHFEVNQVRDVMRFRTASIWRFVLGDGNEGIVILDLILADRDEYRTAIANAVEIVVDDCLINVIELQDLIAVKQLAGRPVDLMDIEALREVLENGEW
jgi:predicted nucleotidyltransferase